MSIEIIGDIFFNVRGGSRIRGSRVEGAVVGECLLIWIDDYGLWLSDNLNSNKVG